MNGILTWVLERLKEKSTWGTLITLVVSATGLTLAPELKDAIIQAALAIVSAIAIGTAAKPKE